MPSEHRTPLRPFLLCLLAALLAVNVLLLLMEGMSTPSEMAAQVIAAEAADRSFGAMVAVGEVIRARGSFEGFSVVSKDLPDFFRAQPPSIRFKSRAAWTCSKFGLLARGATHFENVRRFGKPEWAGEMKVVARWDGIEFYKKVNNVKIK